MAASGKLQQHQLERWILWWFYATAAICTWDASFVVFRPHTLPGGFLHNLFYPYKIYIKIDQRYSDVTDSYSFTQSLLNYAEVVMNIVTIYLHYINSKQTKPMAFTVSVMTFWKTVLYFGMFYEFAGGKDYRSGNTYLEEFLIFVIPNGVWLVLPYMCMVSLWPSPRKDTAMKNSPIKNGVRKTSNGRKVE